MAGSNFCHCLSKIQATLSLLAIHTNYLNTARWGSCTEIMYYWAPWISQVHYMSTDNGLPNSSIFS